MRKATSCLLLFLLLPLTQGCSGPQGSAPSVETGGENGASAARFQAGGTSARNGVTQTLPAFRGTAGILDKETQAEGVATLESVSTASHEHFDRVVFEFQGSALPGYHVEYIDRPVRQCGSGHPVPLAGDGWLLVRLSPAQAHDLSGHSTVENRELQPALPVLKEMKLTCDFEGMTSWVLGLSSPNRYRVLELNRPTRLVVDVLH